MLDEALPGLVPKPADRLPPAPTRFDETCGAKARQVPADERLRQPDMLDQVRDARIPLRESTHDAQAVHVGQCLVNDLELAQVVRLIHDRGQRRADSSRGGTQEVPPRRRINDGLYQRSLMLLPLSGHVNRETAVRTLRP